MNVKHFSLVFTAAVLVLLSGCSRLTMENYDKLEMGMSKAEVEDVIGSADECVETLGAVNCVWGKKDAKHISVNFVADRAVMFSNKGLN